MNGQNAIPPFNVQSYNELRGNKIQSGTNKKGEVYDRYVQYKDGYEELAKIVAGLGKEVKRINQCLTIDGARQYAAKRKNWTAHEADITGKNGHPDGVKEVFVCDDKGNMKVINGFGLRKSDFPWRKAYREVYPTKADRKGNPFTKFKNDYTEIQGFNEDEIPYYKNNTADISPEYTNLQPEITPKALYKQLVFKPVYDATKETLKKEKVPPMVMAQLFNKMLSVCYKNHVQEQILAEMLGADPSEVEAKVVNKLLRSDDFKKYARDKVFQIVTKGDNLNTCQSEVNTILNQEVDRILGRHKDDDDDD